MMSASYDTEQENFWSGTFGDEYSRRNQGPELIVANLAIFARILSRTQSVHSILELGANIGLNIVALRQLIPSASLGAVEINEGAVSQLRARSECDQVFHESILNFNPTDKWDLVFTKGVLIHINPADLTRVYDVLYDASARYVLVAEYYNPNPVEVVYRGHRERLFKRDFAGELLDRFSDLRLVDYGFVWKRDHNFAQDDVTWFLMEKTK